MFLRLDDIIEADPDPVDPRNKQIRISRQLGYAIDDRPPLGYKKYWCFGSPATIEEEIVEWLHELSIKCVLSSPVPFFYFTLTFSREKDVTWFLLKYGSYLAKRQ